MPLWGVGPLPLPGFPMASPLSIGIELQPAGGDRRWVRLWLLDRSAAPSARCRLVQLPRRAAAGAGAAGRPWRRGAVVGVSTWQKPLLVLDGD